MVYYCGLVTCYCCCWHPWFITAVLLHVTVAGLLASLVYYCGLVTCYCWHPWSVTAVLLCVTVAVGILGLLLQSCYMLLWLFASLAYYCGLVTCYCCCSHPWFITAVLLHVTVAGLFRPLVFGAFCYVLNLVVVVVVSLTFSISWRSLVAFDILSLLLPLFCRRLWFLGAILPRLVCCCCCCCCVCYCLLLLFLGCVCVCVFFGFFVFCFFFTVVAVLSRSLVS